MIATAPKNPIVLPVAWLFLLSSCGDGGQPPAPPPPPVVTLTVKAEAIPNIIELTGRIEAVRTAEVRARTDGIVQRRLYEEGAAVAAGTPLFLIDQRDNRAQVQAAQATLQRAVAARQNAAAIVGRYDPLIKERAVSAQEYDKARSDLRQAEAEVLQGRAELARAQLQLGYTTVRAPIAGRVGRAEVTEGALVSTGQGTLLTRVDQVSPVYAVFSESSSAILDMMESYRRGELQARSLADIKVRIVLENGTDYSLAGKIDFRGTVVDPETGSQTIRARFDNPDADLAPGQFVRGLVEAGRLTNGIVVPARAVQLKGQEASVSILGKDGTVAARPVTLGALVGKGWIIQSGLKRGDRVIVEGWQKVRPGQKANSRPAER